MQKEQVRLGRANEEKDPLEHTKVDSNDQHSLAKRHSGKRVHLDKGEFNPEKSWKNSIKIQRVGCVVRHEIKCISAFQDAEVVVVDCHDYLH